MNVRIRYLAGVVDQGEERQARLVGRGVGDGMGEVVDGLVDLSVGITSSMLNVAVRPVRSEIGFGDGAGCRGHQADRGIADLIGGFRQSDEIRPERIRQHGPRFAARGCGDHCHSRWLHGGMNGAAGQDAERQDGEHEDQGQAARGFRTGCPAQVRYICRCHMGVPFDN